MKPHPRKPVDIEMAGGKSKRQRMWEAMRTKQQGFTIQDIAAAADLDMEAVKGYISALKRGQWLVQINDVLARGKTKRYALVRDNGIEAPRVNRHGDTVTQGLAQEQMWRTMRLIGEFDYLQLMANASTPEHPIAAAAARDYLRYLANAGYLQQTAAACGRKPARWQFINNRYSGPRPPMIQRLNAVYDPNLGKVVWQQEVNDDDL